MGPHGLLVGATGSGKSELLRTLVLALAVTHSSEILNFVLVDFKGGATFAALDRLPHTSAVITNLADELSAGRPDARRDPGRAGPPPGAAAQGRQLRLAARLRAGPGGRRAAAPLPSLLIICRRVQRAAHRPARLHRHVRPDRPGGPVARRPPAAGLAAAGGGPAARAGDAPVLPDRPAHVLLDGEPGGARRARRVRAAALARARLPQGRHRGADPVQGRVRLRRRTGGAVAGQPVGGRRSTRSATSTTLLRRAAARTSRRRRSRPTPDARTRYAATRCWTSWSAGWRARACRPTRSGCRRWTSRPPWTSCCRRSVHLAASAV